MSRHGSTFCSSLMSCAKRPFPTGTTGRGETRTPLRCVTRVRNVEILADAPTKNRLPVRLDLDVQGIGAWTQELAVYVPTPEQMAEHAKRLADVPWLAEAMWEKR